MSGAYWLGETRNPYSRTPRRKGRKRGGWGLSRCLLRPGVELLSLHALRLVLFGVDFSVVFIRRGETAPHLGIGMGPLVRVLELRNDCRGALRTPRQRTTVS